MSQIAKKIMVLCMCVVMLCGCGSNTTEAENTVQAYFTALANFNLDAMEASLTEGTNEDMGIDTSVYESHYVQTDTYQKAVISMHKALGKTIEFTINGSEKQEDSTVLVRTALKCADVNKVAVGQFIQARMDEYIKKHPEFETKTELDQNNIGITVMAEAYAEFVQLQPKVSKDVNIAVTKKDGQWRIINGEQNQQLKQWLSEVFETF